ncbi:MAG: hypothetical protein NZM38_09835 [Cytophagales bacterium]|nr:hypothetical protein [Cytophagales bacterium]MDW8385056.1 hypothetical protein [Flammeovirgaceae bacterium]
MKNNFSKRNFDLFIQKIDFQQFIKKRRNKKTENQKVMVATFRLDEEIIHFFGIIFAR